MIIKVWNTLHFGILTRIPWTKDHESMVWNTMPSHDINRFVLMIANITERKVKFSRFHSRIYHACEVTSGKSRGRVHRVGLGRFGRSYGN